MVIKQNDSTHIFEFDASIIQGLPFALFHPLFIRICFRHIRNLYLKWNYLRKSLQMIRIISGLGLFIAALRRQVELPQKCFTAACIYRHACIQIV